jgi:hypothetical protein
MKISGSVSTTKEKNLKISGKVMGNRSILDTKRTHRKCVLNANLDEIRVRLETYY